VSIFTVQSALAHAHTLGVSRTDAGWWLLAVLGRATHERAWLHAHARQVLSVDQAQRFADGLARLADDVPLAYLLGSQPFGQADFIVTPDVLVPRADTHTLVDWALALPLPEHGVTAIDLGTGSGIVALSIAAQRPGWHMHASDLSAAALAVAQANAAQQHLALHWHRGDWLSALPTSLRGQLDVIVSNPPYIAEDDHHLHALRHEPRSALVAGPDGLRDLLQLVAQAPAWLRPGGWLLLEHGFDQSSALHTALTSYGFDSVQSRQDSAGIARCSGGRWPPAG
jgi:release factor glutamine methyltransferase